MLYQTQKGIRSSKDLLGLTTKKGGGGAGLGREKPYTVYRSKTHGKEVGRKN